MNDWPKWATEPVQLEAPDPAWQDQGAHLCRQLDGLLARWLVEPTQHVGSTAVPGLVAKPIIDIQAAVAGFNSVDAIAEVLSPSGWHLVPTDLDGRSWRRFLVKVVDGHRAAHLHVLPAGSTGWDEQLAFRDALRAAPVLVRRYAELKHALATRYADDRESYTNAKTEFIHSVLQGRTSDRN